MRASVSHVLKEVEIQIDSSQNLISRAIDLGMPRIQVEIIAELSFLRIFIAWENFLEKSFIRYLVGAKSPSGYRPAILVNPQNMSHALDLISSGREYVRWNSASEVITRSEIYFRDGGPYKNALLGATTDLNDMNTIRNRIAHKSTFSKNKFSDFVRIKFGHGKRGMTPGRFLLTPMYFPPRITFLDYYAGIIKTASRIIVR